MEILYGLLPVLVVLLGVSAFFSASETALFSLPRREIRTGAVKTVLHDQRALLITVLLGNMFVNVLYSSLSALAAISIGQTHGAIGFAMTSAGALLGLIIIGEVLPKNLALASPITIASVTAPVLLVFERIIRPVRKFFDAVTLVLTRTLLGPSSSSSESLTSDELERMVALGRKKGELGLTQQEFIEDLLDLAELRVREIMVPRVEVIMTEVSEGTAGVLESAASARVTKVPVYETNTDNILGVCHVKDILIHPDSELKSILRKPRYVPESMKVEDLLKHFLEADDSISLVVDEHGTLAGLVTVEDVSEEIVGDILDEYDPDHHDIQELGQSLWQVSGSLSCHNFEEHFQRELVEEKVSTVAGFVIARLGHLPDEGEWIEEGPFRLTVTKVRGKRIRSIRVERIKGNIQ